MNDLLDYYLSWPFKINDPQKLYKRIRRCMELDKPKWVKEPVPDGWKCVPLFNHEKETYEDYLFGPVPGFSTKRRLFSGDTSTDGEPIGCKPYKLSNGRAYKLIRHFGDAEYAAALLAIIRDYESNPVFSKLLEREFNSKGQHCCQKDFVCEMPIPDLSMIEFDGVAA